MKQLIREILIVRLFAFALLFSPFCAHAAESSIAEFVTTTDCLDYFTYLKNHHFYNLNQENIKIYVELKTRNESYIELLTKSLFSDQSTMDRFVETAIKSNKIVLLPVISEFKRRALAQNQRSAYEKFSELESTLTQDVKKYSGVTSFLAYMKNLGPTEKEIDQNTAVPADVAALIESKGPFIGGLYNALADALAYFKQYRIAIEFKEKAIKNFNPASPEEYLFLSEIEKDIALYNYILSDPSTAVKQDSPDHGFFGQALSYILRSIVSLEKANGPSVLLAYRQLFQMRFLYETGRYPEALKILDQVAASESFKTDFAIVGALLLTGLPGGLSEEQHHRLDDFVNTILADQAGSNPTDPLGSHMALLRYFGLKGDWLRFIEQQRKTKELLDTLKPNGDLEMRLSKFYRKDLQPNAEYADYGDADGVLYDKIGDLLRAGKNREALLACEEFIAKYPLSFYYDGVLAAYANCLWGIVTEDIEKYYHMPDWRPGDPSYDAYVSDLTSYFPRASNLRKYLESHAGPSNPPYLLPSCWVGLGIFYWYAYQPELSVGCSKKAYEIDTGAYVDNRPASLEWVSLGYTLWAYQTGNQDHLTAAIQAGKDLLRLFPKYKRIEPVTLNLAANYLFTKQYDSLRSLLASSKNPLGGLLIARSFQESGNLADAEKTYRGVLAGAFPSANAKLAYYPMAFLGLMDTLICQGKFNDAFLLADTFKLDTSQAAANFRKFYDRWVRMHQAGVEVRKWQARSLMPGFIAEGRSGLEKLCSQSSYPDETAYVSTNTDVPLEAMFTTYPDPSNGKPLYYNLEVKFINRFRDDAMFYIGESYEKEGDFDQASVWYQKVIDTFGSSGPPVKSNPYFYLQLVGLEPHFSILSPLFNEFVEKARNKIGIIITKLNILLLKDDSEIVQIKWDDILKNGNKIKIQAIGIGIYTKKIEYVSCKLKSNVTNQSGIDLLLTETGVNTNNFESYILTIDDTLVNNTSGAYKSITSADASDFGISNDSDVFDANTFIQSKVILGSARLNPISGTIPIASPEYIKNAGVELLTAITRRVETSFLVRNQADWLYFSGHGTHYTGQLKASGGRIGPGDIEPSREWDEDLDVVFFAGCSVLDVNDYNDNYWWISETNPGLMWKKAANNIGTWLGYNYSAPKSPKDTKIISDFFTYMTQTHDITQAWMKSNRDNLAANACAIDRSGYWYMNYNLMSRTWKYITNSQYNIIGPMNIKK